MNASKFITIFFVLLLYFLISISQTFGQNSPITSDQMDNCEKNGSITEGLQTLRLSDLNPELQKYEKSKFDGLQFILLVVPVQNLSVEEKFAYEFAKGVGALVEIDHMNLLIARHPEYYTHFGPDRKAAKKILKAAVRIIDLIENKKIVGMPDPSPNSKDSIRMRTLAYMSIAADFRTLDWTLSRTRDGLMDLTNRLASIHPDKSKLIVELFAKASGPKRPSSWDIIETLYRQMDRSPATDEETQESVSLDEDPFLDFKMTNLSPESFGPQFLKDAPVLLHINRFPQIAYAQTGKPEIDACMLNQAMDLAWKELVYQALLNLMDQSANGIIRSQEPSALSLLRSLRDFFSTSSNHGICEPATDHLARKIKEMVMEAQYSGIAGTDKEALLKFMLTKLKPYRKLMLLAKSQQEYMEKTAGLSTTALSQVLNREISNLEHHMETKPIN